MEYTTLEKVIKLLEEKYHLNKHFEGWVMLVLKKDLDVKVSRDLDIEYLAEAYKVKNEFPIDALYREVCYENGFSFGSFVNYCAPRINKYLILNSENGYYYISKENLNLVYNKIKEVAEEFKKEDLASPDEVDKDLTEKYGIDNRIVRLYTVTGKILRKEVVDIAKNILKQASNTPITYIDKVYKSGLNPRKEWEDSRKNTVYPKTLYKLITEKCGEDDNCVEYIFNEFGEDILIPEKFVENFEKVIDEYITKYHEWKNLKERIELEYIR